MPRPRNHQANIRLPSRSLGPSRGYSMPWNRGRDGRGAAATPPGSGNPHRGPGKGIRNPLRPQGRVGEDDAAERKARIAKMHAWRKK